jgi:hypothetical protein
MCHLLALLEAHHILHVSRKRVKGLTACLAYNSPHYFPVSFNQHFVRVCCWLDIEKLACFHSKMNRTMCCPCCALHPVFIPVALADCDDSCPFSGPSSIPLCYVPFPSTLFHQLVCHPTSFHLATYFLVYLSSSMFPNLFTECST